MKDIREIKPGNYGDPRRNALVVHQTAHVGLVKVNRFLFGVVLLLLAIVFLFGFSLVQPSNRVAQFINGQVVDKSGEVLIKPVLADEIRVLKSQMVGLISGSIESKLRVLELSIKSGELSPADLGIISALRNDFSVLRDFSDLKQARLFASKQEKTTEFREADQLIREMTQLKMLIYITIASCGLMLAAIAGVWLQNRYLLSYEKKLLKANSRSVED